MFNNSEVYHAENSVLVTIKILPKLRSHANGE